MTQAIREFAQYTQAKVFQNRQHVGQRQWRIGVIQLAMQLLTGALTQRLVEAHHQRVFLAQAHQVLHVDHGRVRGKALAITCREALARCGVAASLRPLPEADPPGL